MQRFREPSVPMLILCAHSKFCCCQFHIRLVTKLSDSVHSLARRAFVLCIEPDMFAGHCARGHAEALGDTARVPE